MASDAKTVAFIVDQAGGEPHVTARRMFGEFGLYRAERMVAMVCDDRLFLKPTAGGRALLPDAMEAPPYPGAKPCLVVADELWDDGERLAELFRVTAAELPAAKPKRGRAARA